MARLARTLVPLLLTTPLLAQDPPAPAQPPAPPPPPAVGTAKELGITFAELTSKLRRSITSTRTPFASRSVRSPRTRRRRPPD